MEPLEFRPSRQCLCNNTQCQKREKEALVFGFNYCPAILPPKKNKQKKTQTNTFKISLMNHPSGFFLNVLVLLFLCCWSLTGISFPCSPEGINKPTVPACPCQTVKLLWHTSPIKSQKAAAVNRSVLWCTIDDPQVVPVSGLCLPLGGHLHKRSAALWLLDSREGKLLSLYPSSHPSIPLWWGAAFLLHTVSYTVCLTFECNAAACVWLHMGHMDRPDWFSLCKAELSIHS